MALYRPTGKYSLKGSRVFLLLYGNPKLRVVNVELGKKIMLLMKTNLYLALCAASKSSPSKGLVIKYESGAGGWCGGGKESCAGAAATGPSRSQAARTRSHSRQDSLTYTTGHVEPDNIHKTLHTIQRHYHQH